MINDNTAQWRLKKITNVINNFDGYWQEGETVKVGDLRFPRGQENTGYILECVGAGITGTVQPEFITTTTNEIANYSDLGVVGRMRMIFNLAEKDVDEVLAMGVTYSRLTYPELWDWAGKRAGLIISEEEWQARFAETNGKFVPYYSIGDGSNTFRTPLLGAYAKGAETAGDVGEYLEAGLPNIEGNITKGDNEAILWKPQMIVDGAFSGSELNNSVGINSMATTTGHANSIQKLGFDASLSSSIYGNSDTVTPDTMTGIWVIKAVGIVVDSGETDIAQCLTATEQVQERVSVVEDNTVGISDYIIESYRNGTEWYEVYKSGKVRQGGYSVVGVVNFLKPFKDTTYTISGMVLADASEYTEHLTILKNEKLTNKVTIKTAQYSSAAGTKVGYHVNWIAEGQGA